MNNYSIFMELEAVDCFSLMSKFKGFLFEPHVFPQFRIGSALISPSKYTILFSVYDG